MLHYLLGQVSNGCFETKSTLVDWVKLYQNRITHLSKFGKTELVVRIPFTNMLLFQNNVLPASFNNKLPLGVISLPQNDEGQPKAFKSWSYIKPNKFCCGTNWNKWWCTPKNSWEIKQFVAKVWLYIELPQVVGFLVFAAQNSTATTSAHLYIINSNHINFTLVVLL